MHFANFLRTPRSSHHRCSLKKVVLRDFTKFTGKHLGQSLFFYKVVGLRPATLLKKRLWHRCFSVKFMKFLRTPLLQNTSGRLLLREDIVLIILSCNIKCGIMAKLKIYHLFAIALIRSCRRKRKNILKSSRQGFWNRPLFTDRATSGAFTN